MNSSDKQEKNIRSAKKDSIKQPEKKTIDKIRQNRFTWTPADVKVQDENGNWIRGDEFLK